MSCKTCGITRKLGYWDSVPLRTWMRPILFMLSISAFLVGLHVLAISLTASLPDYVAMAVVLLLAASCIGFWASVFACDHCVARLFILVRPYDNTVSAQQKPIHVKQQSTHSYHE